MTCANCDRRFTPVFASEETDYFCHDCRKIEDIIAVQKFPESDKLVELHESDKGRGVQSFLNWLKAAGYAICEGNDMFASEAVARSYDREYRYPTHKSDEELMREWWEIDEDELQYELDALYRSLKRS